MSILYRMMHLALLGSVLVFISTLTFAQSLPKEVVAALDKADISVSNVGVSVLDQDGTAVLSHNTQKAMTPASVMKLMTTAAALDILGPAYTWQTNAYTDGRLHNGDLEGNLVLQGGGDPRFVIEKLWLFLREIRDKGVQSIEGDVVVDNTLFDADDTHFVSFDEAPQNPYNVYPNGFLLNYKTFAVRLIPQQKQVNVTVEPAVDIKITPPALAAKGVCGNWKDQLHLRFEKNKMIVDGVYPESCGEQVWYVHPDQLSSVQYMDLVFRQMWKELGGKFKGNVVLGKVPRTAKVLVQFQSEPLIDIVRYINKYSNNVMARQLLLTLAANMVAIPGRASDGQQVIQAWLEKQGINASQLVMENGSGLSRSEQLTPAMLSKMLLNVFQSGLMPELMSSLPIIGIDGTMRRRLKDGPIVGQGHIKTGTLNNVRAISGYIRAESGKYYIVSALINDDNAALGGETLDILLQWVYRH